MSNSPKIGRREFLSQTGQTAAGLMLVFALPVSALAAGSKRLKVAAVVTEFTYRSHAHVILENFVQPYLFNGQWTDPGMDIVSLYLDQSPANELGHSFAEKYHIPIYKSVAEALCSGSDKLAV